MTEFLNGLLRLVLQLVLVVFALIFIGSLLVAAALLAGVWSLRALWAKLTGRPVTPWTIRVNPGARWGQVFRAGERFTPRARPAAGASRDLSDVTDVQIKEPSTR